jgi:hypothetical protein
VLGHPHAPTATKPATSPGTGVTSHDPLNRELFQKTNFATAFSCDTPTSGIEPVRACLQHLSCPMQLFFTKGVSSAAVHVPPFARPSSLLGAPDPTVKPAGRPSPSSTPRQRGRSGRCGARRCVGRCDCRHQRPPAGTSRTIEWRHPGPELLPCRAPASSVRGRADATLTRPVE